MKFIYTVLVCALLASCGATVAVDYEKQTDFSVYKTYNYYPSINSGLSELDNKRIIKSTDSLLQTRGFKKSSSPQFYINFFAKEQLSNSRSSIGVGVGSGGRNGGFGISGGIPIGGKSVNQQFTIDFIDVQKDDLFWQAIVDGNYKEKASPLQKEKYYFTIIEKALKKYPPKTK